MSNLENIHYNNTVSHSDINEHLETLRKYASECKHVTEFGVRTGNSLCAIVLGKSDVVRAYDIHIGAFQYNDVISTFSKINNIDFSILENDVLNVEIEETDMLFIDTLHTYNQLKAELQKHSYKVRKYIVLHDTAHFATCDESIYEHASDIVKTMSTTTQGLQAAIDEFLTNNTFKIKEQFTNNNGLTILERITT